MRARQIHSGTRRTDGMDKGDMLMDMRLLKKNLFRLFFLLLCCVWFSKEMRKYKNSILSTHEHISYFFLTFFFTFFLHKIEGKKSTKERKTYEVDELLPTHIKHTQKCHIKSNIWIVLLKYIIFLWSELLITICDRGSSFYRFWY